jgi:quinol monooxygenase YgiN
MLLLAMCFRPRTTISVNTNELVRLAVIEVDSSHIKAYNDLLKEEIEASIRLEQGVITLYAVAEKANPSNVTLFETYADSSQYRSHLATPHFQKYKLGTLPMVDANKIVTDGHREFSGNALLHCVSSVRNHCLSNHKT